MKKYFLVSLVLTLLIACSPSPKQNLSLDNQVQDSEVPLVETTTPTVTNTPKPTSTPRPTNTPIPPSPEDIIEEFLKAAQNFDGEAMAAFIDPSNTDDINETKSISASDNEETPLFLLELLETNAKKIEFRITDCTEDGNHAVVTAAVRYRDSGPILKATIAEAFSKIMELTLSGAEITDEQTDELFQTIMQEQIKQNNKTYKEATLNINMIKLGITWFISAVDETLKDIIMSGFVSAGKEFSDIFSNDDDTP